ncbi:DUF3973 domain-containing protein [Bacillus clarus]|uniref:DUF3973 domain-containing protein n=1 Tax=Bacillus clarus TaxID=2338372 RepID=A0A090YU62_9BACI|nr:DUF3973 domain-containing protein [Bacillus clarus]KFN01965.1 hypothetical protein DJ93_1736 [Bacillus clarus]RFT68101.1 DUF3973 domain-containing protein [Bacillus clarus]
MFYCINCSEIHHEKHVSDKVFKNGFYIDPFLGERYHLGMCKDVHHHEKAEVMLTTKETETPQSIMNTLPTHVVPT